MKKIKHLLVAACIAFSGTLLCPEAKAVDISGKNVRVGVLTDTNNVYFSTSSKGAVFHFDNGTMTKIADVTPQEPWMVTNKNGALEIRTEKKSLPVPKEGKLIIKNMEQRDGYSPLVYAGKHWFRGYLEIFISLKNNQKVTVVNTLPLEEYLYGVVPSEMPASWPLEALKTQAVAARTYALTHLGQFAAEGFDLMPTTTSQVYGGVEEETPNSNRAVNETRGKVITYNSKMISAFYFASSGGITESGFDAWGQDIPYLKPVTDYDQDSPRYLWYKTINNNELQEALKKEFTADIGQVLKFTIMDVTASNRVKTLKVEGTNGSVEIDGKKFRFALKLNSTLFRVEPQDVGTSVNNGTPIPNLFMFIGRGWGHGAGMSQWGARALAKSGKTHDQILRHYYQGTEVVDAVNAAAGK